MSYIFVGGAQRSGTTLLTQALCSGEETNPYIGESGNLRALLQVHKLMEQRFDDESIVHFGSREAMDEYFGTCVRSFLSHTLATNSPATSLVLKEPHLTMHFPLLWKLIPTTKFVMSIRDPRDIVASMLRVGEKLKKQGVSHLFNSGNIDGIAKNIVPFYAPTIQFSQGNETFKKSVFWLKYEAFLSDPEKTVRRLASFTGLPLDRYDPENSAVRIHPIQQEALAKNDRITPWVSSLMLQKGIEGTNAGKYKSNLTTKQIKAVENAVPGLMKRFGYQNS